MLTTTIDGLWVLQVLAGIEMLTPELALRPTLPDVETVQMALAHPVAHELCTQAVIDATGNVDPIVREWLTVLARRDIALLLQTLSPNAGTTAQCMLTRFDQWWVSIERFGPIVRLGGVGTSHDEAGARVLLQTQIERLCGTALPADFRPISLDEAEVRAAAASPDSLHAFLTKQPMGAAQLRILQSAADPGQSTQTSIVALQGGVETGRPTRTHVEPGAVTIIDTSEGRLVVEHTASPGGQWMILAPGTANNIASAVNMMLSRLPAAEQWHSYGRAF